VKGAETKPSCSRGPDVVIAVEGSGEDRSQPRMRNLLQEGDGRDLSEGPGGTDETASHNEGANVMCEGVDKGSDDEYDRADCQGWLSSPSRIDGRADVRGHNGRFGYGQQPSGSQRGGMIPYEGRDLQR
jgi:hypothetical protein